MVNVALGIDDLSACTAGDANGDGQITIDEIVAALRNALTGCPPLDVAGAWLEDQFHLTFSTCAPQVTQAFAMAWSNLPPCLTQLTVPEVGVVSGVDCKGVAGTGQLEPTGFARFTLPPETATANGCTVSGMTALSIDLSKSPTTARYDSNLRFAGTCSFLECQITLESNWARQ